MRSRIAFLNAASSSRDPSATTRTEPSDRFFTHPTTANPLAIRQVVNRKPTPCTVPQKLNVALHSGTWVAPRPKTRPPMPKRTTHYTATSPKSNRIFPLFSCFGHDLGENVPRETQAVQVSSLVGKWRPEKMPRRHHDTEFTRLDGPPPRERGNQTLSLVKPWGLCGVVATPLLTVDSS